MPAENATLLPGPASPAEASELHTGILRLTLALEESWRYWEHVDPSVPRARRVTQAFEERWFGAKSLERVRYLITAFGSRFDAFPAALSALSRWRSIDMASRQLICHWHMQLSDPLYRRFADEFIGQRRRLSSAGHVSRDVVLRWLRNEYPNRWAEATLVQFASKLLSAALEAGLVSRRDPRTLHHPKVGDQALAYFFYVLRETRFAGTLTDNPYFRSVGLDQDALLGRARQLPGLRIRSMLQLIEIDWSFPDIATWATALS